MLSELNDHKHLPPKEFDALLGRMLKEQANKRRASMPKRKPEKKVTEKKPAKK